MAGVNLRSAPDEPLKLSDQLERWLAGAGETTLGGLVHAFGDKSFALLLVLLLGVPALPLQLPRGGVTHVFELLAALTALELIAGPRLSFVFHQRITDVLFGLLVLVGTVGAFVSPPFSGLDTLAALGVVVLSLAMLLKDALVAIVAMLLLAAGIVLEIGLGAAVIHGISSIL